LLEDSVEERMEKALAESDKIEAESKDAEAEDNKVKDHNLLTLCVLYTVGLLKYQPYIENVPLTSLSVGCS
jgi:hypothetical protein